MYGGLKLLCPEGICDVLSLIYVIYNITQNYVMYAFIIATLYDKCTEENWYNGRKED